MEKRNILYIFFMAITVLSENCLCKGELTESQHQLLSVIAESNRLNRKILNSFDSQYSLAIGKPKKLVQKSGRYAFSADNIYSMDTVLDSNITFHYVQRGEFRKRRMSLEPGLVLMGSTPESEITPGTPDPWSMIDEGVSSQLDNLDKEKYGEVVSVESLQLENNNIIKVVIMTPQQLPDGTKVSYSVEMQYSENDGYLPVKYELNYNSDLKPGLGGSTVFKGEVRKILKYDVNGSTLFLPVYLHEDVYRNGKLLRTKQYNVDPNSVRINPDLPDTLFQIEIQPDDQVINKDLDMELQGPGGRNLITDNIIEESFEKITEQVLNQNREIKIDISQTKRLTLCQDVVLDLVHIPAGKFDMGSQDFDIGYPSLFIKRFGDRLKEKNKPLYPLEESPLHPVEIHKGFYMGKHEITREQYRCFRPQLQKEPIILRNKRQDVIAYDNCPVNVTWSGANNFCAWLSKKTGLIVRLPSEAEWEYACRAGSQTRFFWGDDEKEAGKYANVLDKTYEKETSETLYYLDTNDGQAFVTGIGQYLPNKFGLYDMIGNIVEWCQNEFYEDAYKTSFDKNASKPNGRVYRGGGCQADIVTARCASRRGCSPDDKYAFIGFRIVVEE